MERDRMPDRMLERPLKDVAGEHVIRAAMPGGEDINVELNRSPNPAERHRGRRAVKHRLAITPRYLNLRRAQLDVPVLAGVPACRRSRLPLRRGRDNDPLLRRGKPRGRLRRKRHIYPKRERLRRPRGSRRPRRSISTLRRTDPLRASENQKSSDNAATSER